MDFSNIEEIENVFIPMHDGIKLAARLFLPKKARQQPVPAILEYIPYRKRDFMRARDESIHRYFAFKNYASVRVDIRGSGDSEGILEDEYSHAELNDALTIIEWLGKQPWCNGAIGMMGISWGGFNSLQVAALKPPALKAIMTLCASDDRYTDDAHYMGGCLLNENMQWGSMLTMYCAYPPDPEIVGESWRDMWAKRIEKLKPFPALWMQHPWRDSYWKHGSICENYEAIEIPIYAIGGWADGYSNAIPRMLEGLKCPRKGLIGPWGHAFPHDALPGPCIGFLQEAVKWWDYWLKGKRNGIMDEPLLRVWMQDSVELQPQYDIRPGRWIAEESWPSQNIIPTTLHFGVGYMGESPKICHPLSFASPETTGTRAGEWCAFGAGGEMPRDQRADDGGSLVFDSDPLDEPLEILGAPLLEVSLESDKPVAYLIARLCDVAPDGSSLRVSYGILNLTHRESNESPGPLTPKHQYQVRIALNDIAHSFPKEHRLRLALSTSYWPIIWPAPEYAAITIYPSESSLTLPVRPPRKEDQQLRPFEDAVNVPPGTEFKKIIHLPMRRIIEMDLSTNELVYTLKGDGGELDGAALARIEDIDLNIGYQMMKRYRIIEADPSSAQTELFQRTEFRRGDWKIRLVCRTKLTATEFNFQFSCDLETFENDIAFKDRSWVVTIPRKLI